MEFILVFEFQLKEMKKKLNIIIKFINLSNTQSCQDDKCAFFFIVVDEIFQKYHIKN